MSNPNLPVTVQADQGMVKAMKQIESLLTESEVVEITTHQLKLQSYPWLHRRIVVCATNNRLIVTKRGLLGGFKMYDVQWQDLKDVRIVERMLPSLFGATLEVFLREDAERPNLPGANNKIVVSGLVSESAKQLYGIAQNQEQSWREKKRVRDMEEQRAAAGGVSIGSPAMGGGFVSQSAQQGGDPLERLSKAKLLNEQGIISDTEFEEIKSKVLSTLSNY